MNNSSSSNDIQEWLIQTIIDFASSSENCLHDKNNETAFELPFVGFAAGNDPLFLELKNDIGEFYLTPENVFTLAFPQLKCNPEDLTIISWILPQRELTKNSNRIMEKQPSELWVRNRYFGELFNENLRKHVVGQLTEKGYQAVAPALPPIWKREKSIKYGIASNWSERHAAFAAGLGTFGLCDGLITNKGKAMRTGSVIVNVKIKPSERNYNGIYEYCLYYKNNSCMECARRCPVKAISEKGHDKDLCLKYLNFLNENYSKPNFNIDITACGLCQTGVPCESRIP